MALRIEHGNKTSLDLRDAGTYKQCCDPTHFCLFFPIY